MVCFPNKELRIKLLFSYTAPRTAVSGRKEGMKELLTHTDLVTLRGTPLSGKSQSCVTSLICILE